MTGARLRVVMMVLTLTVAVSISWISPAFSASEVCAPTLYWANVAGTGAQAGLFRWHVGDATPQLLLPTGVQIAGLALDSVAGTMTWTDVALDGVRRANLDGRDSTDTSLPCPSGFITGFEAHGNQALGNGSLVPRASSTCP